MRGRGGPDALPRRRQRPHDQLPPPPGALNAVRGVSAGCRLPSPPPVRVWPRLLAARRRRRRRRCTEGCESDARGRFRVWRTTMATRSSRPQPASRPRPARRRCWHPAAACSRRRRPTLRPSSRGSPRSGGPGSPCGPRRRRRRAARKVARAGGLRQRRGKSERRQRRRSGGRRSRRIYYAAPRPTCAPSTSPSSEAPAPAPACRPAKRRSCRSGAAGRRRAAPGALDRTGQARCRPGTRTLSTAASQRGGAAAGKVEERRLRRWAEAGTRCRTSSS